MDKAIFETAHLAALNDQQRAAVEAVNGPVLLLAVPGSGKTTVLITRLGYMTEVCGIAPEAILTMTYTVAATQEMRARFAARFGGELAARLEFRTINGVAARIIALYSRMYGRTPPELIRNESETTPLLMRLWQDTNHEYPAESTVKDLRTAITYIKNMCLTDAELDELETDIENLPDLYRDYQKALKAAHKMDYDDQLCFALQILRGAPAVAAAFRKRYKYFCVDESQDTSKVQHEIIRVLAQESGNIFMVGDEDQSIYGFRAAYPQALMDFEKTYPGAQILLMEQNYRSTEPILEAASRFVARNRFRRPKTIAPTQGPGAPLQIVTVPRRADQLPFLFETAQHCDTGTAVLFRNHESALPIIDLCERRGIPYACKAVDQTFFTNKIVRDVTDIFTLAAHPADGETFLRCYYKFGVPVTRAPAPPWLTWRTVWRVCPIWPRTMRCGSWPTSWATANIWTKTAWTARSWPCWKCSAHRSRRRGTCCGGWKSCAASYKTMRTRPGAGFCFRRSTRPRGWNMTGSFCWMCWTAFCPPSRSCAAARPVRHSSMRRTGGCFTWP